ncbi:hypothetical protein [Aporhodopirellula aestuarii]|uniref:Uncharacterized protein n=1 Tax=Aporhodopirellula aestuarii TaxID=2950107 RepID=A0ABT0U0C0_9BACT|nr:hypothetical protein [Aporhodopirellula aestuarii]MCM2370280.1 hypothetical protein [Aporhodopirellula aestuarii]
MITVGIVGLPLSAPPIEKTGRFPCEDCPCGCATAEFCWDKCCCHSDIEKLTWATENNVTPPTFLIDRVNADSRENLIAANKPKPAANSCCCCSGTTCAPKPACATESASTASQAAAGSDREHQTTDADTKTRLRFVRIEDAARCHGIDMIWSLFAEATIETRPVEVATIEPRFLYSLAIANDRAVSRALCPDPPVP